MAEWTSEAREFLDGYLHQVAALSRSQGDDDEGIVTELREHITSEVEASAGSLVTLESLRRVLASVGTPEQVASPDFTLAKTERRDTTRTNGTPPVPPWEPQIVVSGPPQKFWSGCWLALAVAVVLMVVAIIAIPVLSIIGAIALPAVSRSREAAQRATCQNNLKQMGLVCKMWAGEHRDVWPPLSSTPGDFCIDPASIYPEYLTDPNFLQCPSNPTAPATSLPIEKRLGDGSYFYLGYTVTNEKEGHAFVEAYGKQAALGTGFEENLPVAPGSGTGGSDQILRLRDDRNWSASETAAEADVFLPAPAQVPVMFDRDSTHHLPGGINVLYLDGHTEFVKMEGKFPAQQWFLDALADLDE